MQHYRDGEEEPLIDSGGEEKHEQDSDFDLEVRFHGLLLIPPSRRHAVFFGLHIFAISTHRQNPGIASTGHE